MTALSRHRLLLAAALIAVAVAGCPLLDRFRDGAPDATIVTLDEDATLVTDAGQGAESDAASPPPWCELPNPVLGSIASDLEEPWNVLEDGGFEEGTADVVLDPHHDRELAIGAAARVEGAARSGGWGYELVTGAAQGVAWSVRGGVDPGEELRFGVWARSPGGVLDVQPTVLLEGPDGESEAVAGTATAVGAAWTELTASLNADSSVRTARLQITLGPDATLHLDDARLDVPLWRVPTPAVSARSIGGVDVPPVPAAPVRWAVLLQLDRAVEPQTGEADFRERTAIAERLAALFHAHGGMLTIQTDQGWPLAAESGLEPGLLARLAGQYGVSYSVYTHGPVCTDPNGAPRGTVDCADHPEWSRVVTDDSIMSYVGQVRGAITASAGAAPTDLSGVFDFPHTTRFAEAGILTWSAYRSGAASTTYDAFVINPWRPTEGDATINVAAFLTHAPATQLVYIPGMSRPVSYWHDRLLPRTRRMLANAITDAHPDRVNAFYRVVPLDRFASTQDDPSYVEWDPDTGQVTTSSEFESHLAHWEQLLSELVDPLVAEGYLQWSSLPATGAEYLAWEAACE